MELLITVFSSLLLFSGFLGPDIFLSTPFLSTLSLSSPTNVRDQVSQPHRQNYSFVHSDSS
jgi:hypothetical protein